MKLRIKGITSRAGTLFLSFFQMVGQTKERNNGRPKERKEKRVLVKVNSTFS
jgi:hypothetical protein